MTTRYVYMKSEPGLWTVGYYDPAGAWQPEEDVDSKHEAAVRCAWLNGSGCAHVLVPYTESARTCVVCREQIGL